MSFCHHPRTKTCDLVQQDSILARTRVVEKKKPGISGTDTWIANEHTADSREVRKQEYENIRDPFKGPGRKGTGKRWIFEEMARRHSAFRDNEKITGFEEKKWNALLAGAGRHMFIMKTRKMHGVRRMTMMMIDDEV